MHLFEPARSTRFFVWGQGSLLMQEVTARVVLIDLKFM